MAKKSSNLQTVVENTNSPSNFMSLGERRRSKQSQVAGGLDQPVIKHATKALQEIERTATILSRDISSALHEEIEDLAIHSSSFRQAINRVFLKMLRIGSQKTEKVVIFHEAIPGFMLMLFKKVEVSPLKVEKESEEVERGPELAAAGMVVNKFIERTGGRVITIETDDAVFVFFPSADIKKNVREMGFYITE